MIYIFTHQMLAAKLHPLACLWSQGLPPACASAVVAGHQWQRRRTLLGLWAHRPVTDLQHWNPPMGGPS